MTTPVLNDGDATFSNTFTLNLPTTSAKFKPRAGEKFVVMLLGSVKIGLAEKDYDLNASLKKLGFVPDNQNKVVIQKMTASTTETVHFNNSIPAFEALLKAQGFEVEVLP